MRDYTEKVAEIIREMRPELQVTVSTKGMPDGSEYFSITVRAVDANVAPSIYTDDMKKQGFSVERAAKTVLELYDKHKDDGNKLSIDWFMDFENVKKKLTVRLLPKTFHAEIFRSAKRYGFDDLILVPYVSVDDASFGKGSILIKESHLEQWGVTSKEVLDKAIANTKREDVKIRSMAEYLVMMGGPTDMVDSVYGPVVVSNNDTLYGASAILAKMKEYKDKYENGFYVIPSSVHEVIVLPNDGTMSVDDLSVMVKCVNAETLLPEDVLSDHAYAFV